MKVKTAIGLTERLTHIEQSFKTEVEKMVDQINLSLREHALSNGSEVMEKRKSIFFFDGNVLEEFGVNGMSDHRIHKAYIREASFEQNRKGDYQINVATKAGTSTFLYNIAPESLPQIEQLVARINAPRAETHWVEAFNSHGHILAFDGFVLEKFGHANHSSDNRIHIRNINGVSLEENKKGLLEIKLRTHPTHTSFLRDINPDNRKLAEDFVIKVNSSVR